MVHPYKGHSAQAVGARRANKLVHGNEYARGGAVKRAPGGLIPGGLPTPPPCAPPNPLAGGPPMPPPGGAPPGGAPPGAKRGGAIKRRAEGGGVATLPKETVAPKPITPGPIEKLGVSTYKRELGRNQETGKFGKNPYYAKGGKVTAGAGSGLGRLQISRAQRGK